MARLPKGVSFTVKVKRDGSRALPPEAVEFLAALHRALESERQRLLGLRRERAAAFAKGALPDFLAATAAIRLGDWKVAPIPRDLQDRRVEIVAPTSRRAMIAALNSGAKTLMADFDDMTVPTWENLVEGQINLIDRWTSAMDHVDAASGKRVALGQKPAVLTVRPRAMHCDEAHLTIDGKPVSASLFDAGLYLFHNARTAVAKASGPYLALPKIESHHEARWWNSFFILAQSLLGLPLGTIKATVLIETLPAAFEMDEILYELRDHAAGLACGVRNHAFSLIKTCGRQRAFVLPEDPQPDAPNSFGAALSALLIKTCHHRGCHAVGDLKAHAPNRADGEAVLKSAAERQAREGFDGTSISHADLVAAVAKVFNDLMPTPHQHYVGRDDVTVGQKDLLAIAKGNRSEAGLRDAIRTGVAYLDCWLRGRGAVTIAASHADMAAAELARAQLWQWLACGAPLDGGGKFTRAVFDSLLNETVKQLKQQQSGEEDRLKDAAALFKAAVVAKEFPPFLSTAAMKKLG